MLKIYNINDIKIERRGKKRIDEDIPYDGKIIYDGLISYYNEPIHDEVGKLNYLIQIITTIMEENGVDEDGFEGMINHRYFRLLQDVIKEERNTDLIYKTQEKSFPYYSTIYDDCYSMKKVFGKEFLEDDNNFKERCREIIFDPEIAIIDKENEY
jgi:hypothetical protein